MNREEELSQIIGSNIKTIIERNNLTQKEFADIIGVQESAVGKWVLGKNSPRMGTIQKISDKFGVDKSWILTRHDNDFLVAESPAEYNANPHRQYLMDKIAKADDRKLDKIKRLMELIDDEEDRNW
jgi:transcriptional regulator with XRE-family HTH domain